MKRHVHGEAEARATRRFNEMRIWRGLGAVRAPFCAHLLILELLVCVSVSLVEDLFWHICTFVLPVAHTVKCTSQDWLLPVSPAFLAALRGSH